MSSTYILIGNSEITGSNFKLNNVQHTVTLSQTLLKWYKNLSI